MEQAALTQVKASSDLDDSDSDDLDETVEVRMGRDSVSREQSVQSQEDGDDIDNFDEEEQGDESIRPEDFQEIQLVDTEGSDGEEQAVVRTS